MRILTWNVLHRVHAETHSEPAIRRWPDEAERVRGVASLLSEALKGCQVALLQEVSGDVLAELRTQLVDWAVLNHQYPRVPRQKGEHRSVSDPTEHLVVVAPKGAKVLRAQTFTNDPGKGFLMVSVSDGLAVLSTHVTWGAKGEAQLPVLAELLAETPGLCIGGDFNTGREVISKIVGADVAFSVPPAGSARTRPQNDPTGGADIDHLLSRTAELADVAVLEHRDLSDHRPVAATIR
jgi:endonuclease/exonuclease/phosphatase family metal-dependent hydrolase